MPIAASVPSPPFMGERARVRGLFKFCKKSNMSGFHNDFPADDKAKEWPYASKMVNMHMPTDFGTEPGNQERLLCGHSPLFVRFSPLLPP